MKYSLINKPVLFTLFILLSALAYSQDAHEHNHEHDHKIELGIGNSAVYFLNEKEFSYGLHFHAVRKIPHTKIGLGLGYERIFDEHKHNTAGLVAVYEPINKLHIAISPGITFEGTEISHSRFAFHFETVYDFQIGDIHLGPLLEFAYDVEDYHVSLGLHFGIGL